MILQSKIAQHPCEMRDKNTMFWNHLLSPQYLKRLISPLCMYLVFYCGSWACKVKWSTNGGKKSLNFILNYAKSSELIFFPMELQNYKIHYSLESIAIINICSISMSRVG